MYKIAEEIFRQYNTLRKTYDYMLGRAEDIRSYINAKPYSSVTFLGCGSSYSICKSSEASYRIRTCMPANSFAAGDLLINHAAYEKLMKDTLLVIPSRSGSTSEVVLAAKSLVEETGTACISICARKDSELSHIQSLCLEIPWAFDESVCQTGTVTNLYLANLLLIGIIINDVPLLRDLDSVINMGDSYIKQVNPTIEKIVECEEWEKVIVLADSELAGIAEEGALAFNEICRLPSNYYHVLDVRHGPMVLVDNATLAIVMCSPDDFSYQKDLVCDLKSRGAVVVTVSDGQNTSWGSDYSITVPSFANYGVYGIPFIFVPQLLSYYKALKRGVNPDAPEGLNPWIKL